MRIVEKRFRGSQICRVLSYPISYAITKLLLDKGSMSFNEIVNEVGRTKSTVCTHLSKLRLANIVRFEKNGRLTAYWIKYPEEVRQFMTGCENLVVRVSQKLQEDV